MKPYLARETFAQTTLYTMKTSDSKENLWHYTSVVGFKWLFPHCRSKTMGGE